MIVTDTPADWYPDPDSPGILRFWDGTAWTERRKPMQQEQTPPHVVVHESTSGFAILIVLVLAVAVVGLFWYYFG